MLSEYVPMNKWWSWMKEHFRRGKCYYNVQYVTLLGFHKEGGPLHVWLSQEGLKPCFPFFSYRHGWLFGPNKWAKPECLPRIDQLTCTEDSDTYHDLNLKRQRGWNMYNFVNVYSCFSNDINIFSLITTSIRLKHRMALPLPMQLCISVFKCVFFKKRMRN